MGLAGLVILLGGLAAACGIVAISIAAAVRLGRGKTGTGPEVLAGVQESLDLLGRRLEQLEEEQAFNRKLLEGRSDTSADSSLLESLRSRAED